MKTLALLENVRSLIIKNENEHIWSEKATKHAKTVLNHIQELRQIKGKSEIKYQQAIIHEMVILASLTERTIRKD